MRRLASEATRPLLPWAPRIQLPVDAALPVLDQLYDDVHLYVRTSVANHLSDIAASRPDLVLTTLQRWKRSGRLADEHFAFIARGALRNRLKEGWPPAYAILGYAHDAPISLTSLTLERTGLRDGDTLNFSAALTAEHLPHSRRGLPSRPGACCPQPPEGVNRPDRTSLSRDRPEPARPGAGIRTSVHQMPSLRAVTGPGPVRF
ncbi:hypothetical protein ACGFNV_18105 [Streptomyces sp. NPDC048751]|uniref:hypothetical protein n=1 Tax=Streptomyces sp. NPDC048751 TaxID=3365591 RepID=UPI00371568F1